MNTSIPIELTNNHVRQLTYSVLVDIYNDNTFSCEITNDVFSIDNVITDLELKQTGEVIGKPSVNTASITLHNTNGFYSPNNPKNIESKYPGGKFRSNTRIKILAGFIDSSNQPKTRCIFFGVITAFSNKGTKDDCKIALTLKDYAKYLQKKKNPDHDYNEANAKYYESVLFDKTITEAVNYLIDYAFGESFPRTVHNLTEKLPYIEFPIDQSIWTTIQNLSQAVNARTFFEEDQFKFYTPLSLDYEIPYTSQYTFTADNIQDYTEVVDEDNIINQWKITSNAKTMQVRQVLCGTPSSNQVSAVDEYWTNDGKNALGSDNKTITLKSQLDDLSWIDSLNVPLVSTTTYSDLPNNVTQSDIDQMNLTSLIKVFDRVNNKQLTINSLDLTAGKIVLLEEIDSTNYNLQITYQYQADRIVHEKYRWYEYDLEKNGANIEYPLIEADNTFDPVTYSYTDSNNTLYLSDWAISKNNKHVKFKLTNNVPIDHDIGYVRITKSEIYGNALECVTPLTFQAIDGDTIKDFQNPYEISNDYIINTEWGKKAVDYYLYRYEKNLTFLTVNTKGIPQIDLLDRITITETCMEGLGNSFDFIVTSIKHSISRNNGWKTELQLESLIPPWVYDPSRVNALYYRFGDSSLNLYSFTNPPAPTNLEATEQTFLQKSGEVVTRVYVTFVPPTYIYYSTTIIQMSNDGGRTFKDVGTSNNGKYFAYNVLVGNTYVFRGKTESLNGLMSDPVDVSVTIKGKDTPPSDITSFNLVQNDITLLATIKEAPDPDIKYYMIRTGPTWNNSTFIKTFVGNSTTFEVIEEGTKSFWVKAIDNSGNESINAKLAMITVYGLTRNVIDTISPDPSTWTTIGMYWDYINNCWKMDSAETFDSGEVFADIFEGGTTFRTDSQVIFPAIDLGPNIVEDNYFYYDPWGNAKLKTGSGSVVDYFANYSSPFSFCGQPFSYVTPQFRLITSASVSLNYDAGSNNNVSYQYCTSFDGKNFGNWISLVNRQFFGRYIQTEAYCTSSDNTSNVSIYGVTIYIDVPDIDEKISSTLIAATGTTRVYLAKKFFWTDRPELVSLDTNGKQCIQEIVGNQTYKDSLGNWYFDVRLWDLTGTIQIAGTVYGVQRGF